MLLALGYLREEDGSYAGRFRLERGRLEVNGVTLDLPGLEAG